MQLNPDQMQMAAAEAEDLLKAVANRHRLMILCQLLDTERPVGDLADLLQLRPSTVSQHLALLRKDELVSTRREGQTIWYSIASDPARRLVETLYRIYCAPSPSPARKCAPRKRNRAKTEMKERN